MNIPIYRALNTMTKKYIIGHLITAHGIPALKVGEDFVFTIDTNTLAIHFNDMKDINGTKLFASLSEDGKGGDIIEEVRSKGVVFLEKGRCKINWIIDKDFFSSDLCNHCNNSKISGIQK